MKAGVVVATLFGACASAVSEKSRTVANPLGTVLSLIDELQAKTIKEGEAEAKAYAKYFEWCDDTAKNGEHAVKTANAALPPPLCQGPPHIPCAMKTGAVIAALFGSFASAVSEKSRAVAHPLGTVLSLIDELQAKTIKEGEAEAKAYAAYFEWCDDTAKNGEHAVKTATDQKAKLEAKIGELTSNIDV
eukprot:CAMPEP_0176039240 /NCGR_PEP_ID=MMETSP0120_2-20121206/19451_1 /TAXON_ID=160619 /ORGANISM="Kryptoperidinium foliaceum, Strain CCMP 1326" /LENGTH=188 /DNA_ID=CAMNT_0017372635 /DNA_START=59 /DNA_END=622 /DNA_ORIENTATION=+